MWQNDWRDRTWSTLEQPWDLIVIGGGITGAGILREARRAGLRVLLVEADDFGSGTSSRSSKLVHGGFRYLKNAQIRLTLQSVRERERLLKEGRGLVSPLGILLATFKGDAIPGWVFGAGLILYDLLALKWGHRPYDAYDMRELCAILTEEGLSGGYRYFDAQTDDARLVLRVIEEAVQDGAVALNYARVSVLLRQRSGQVCGVQIQDQTPDHPSRTAEVKASMVINATGAWADDLRGQLGQRSRLRKLRGSHLIIPAERLPLTRSVSFLHPQDGRPVFAFPWEGVTLVGTTDEDHEFPLDIEPAISPGEVEYLLKAVQVTFPVQELDLKDIQGTFSGVRPVVNTGKADPSKESREHVFWLEKGLLTVTGGKLTTFRLMAHDALERTRSHLPGKPEFDPDQRVLAEPPDFTSSIEGLTPSARLRLLGRHGANAPHLLAAAQPGELEPIGRSFSLWAELRWAARSEAVVHLDDLLLRRVRLGLLLPEGGLHHLAAIRSIVQPELGWDDARWEQEAASYISLWKQCYSLPG
ncbi:MAG: glycerol-3-phosphate dehydrogenase/oxidase [Anaerolineales bacterium]|nr:glycerol-3-phosphate dehydrogenase/oxidase [Anaerolineales bacterium]